MVPEKSSTSEHCAVKMLYKHVDVKKHVVFADSCCKVSKRVPPIWGFVLSQLRIVEQEMYIRKNLQNSDSSVHRVLDASL